MVAYSFQKQFAAPILAGTKRQTIRAIGKRRHARPGEELQLYTGMRTRQCNLIARKYCKHVTPVRMFLDAGIVEARYVHLYGHDVDAFARADGFGNWKELREFWRVHHPGVSEFKGVLVEW